MRWPAADGPPEGEDMAQTHRTTVAVSVSDAREARRLLAELKREFERELLRRHGKQSEVHAEDLTDSEELADSLLGSGQSAEVSLTQSFKVFRGWRGGAELSLRWDSKTPGQLVVSAGALSKLEDVVMTSLALVLGGIGAVLGFFSIRWRLIGALVAGVLGAALGLGLYYILARPILSLFQGVGRKAGETLAALLSSQATRLLRERMSGKTESRTIAAPVPPQSPGTTTRVPPRSGPGAPAQRPGPVGSAGGRPRPTGQPPHSG